jgi:Rieske Fe-S protein
MDNQDRNEKCRGCKSRRDFIGELAGGLATLTLAAPLIASNGPGEPRPPKSALAELKIEDHPELKQVGGYVIVKKTAAGDVLVIRSSASEYSALSVVCPHLQCNVKVKSANLIQCPCHQSGYRADGTYISGPAKTGLRKFPVSVDDNTILIFADA